MAIGAGDYTALAAQYPFMITAEATGKTADVRISGVIHEWNASAEWFQAKIDEFNADGVTLINFHMNTPGGSVFEANGIRNIMDSFKGKIHGWGGALVASAGTYLIAGCDTFEMPPNGQFMYHKPLVFMRGNEDEVAGELVHLKSQTSNYRTTYAELTGISEEEIEKRWSKGDVWMDAKTALKEGFITSIGKKKVKIQEDQKAMFTACAAPTMPEIIKSKSNPKIKIEMDLKLTALQLGLPEDATEAQVTAEMARLRAEAAKVEGLVQEASAKVAADLQTEIQSVLALAVAEKKITPVQSKSFEKWANSDLEGFKEYIATLLPLEKISENIQGKKGTTSAAALKEKSFEALTTEERTTLLEADEAAYIAKYEAYLAQ